MAQLNIGMGLGFSSISVPDLEKEDSDIHANQIEISWFGKRFQFLQIISTFDSEYNFFDQTNKSYVMQNMLFF